MYGYSINRKYLLNIFFGVCILMSVSASHAAANNGSISDATITAKIKAKYLQSQILSVFDIGVTTNNGKVKLTGLLDSDTQYERAVVLAENTEGVKDVNSDNLKIKSSQQPVSDTLITAKIKGILLKDKFVSDETEVTPWSIHVETKNSVVYLTGTVDTSQQKDQIIKQVKLVDGVKSVKADLTTKY